MMCTHTHQNMAKRIFPFVIMLLNNQMVHRNARKQSMLTAHDIVDIQVETHAENSAQEKAADKREIYWRR